MIDRTFHDGKIKVKCNFRGAKIKSTTTSIENYDSGSDFL